MDVCACDCTCVCASVHPYDGSFEIEQKRCLTDIPCTTYTCHYRQWKWQAESCILCWGANGALWYMIRYVYDSDSDNDDGGGGDGGSGDVATHSQTMCASGKKGEINIHIISTAWGTFVDTLELLLTCIYVYKGERAP